MTDQWDRWKELAKSLRGDIGPSEWERRSGVKRGKWAGWESGRKPDAEGFWEMASVMEIPVERLMLILEGRDAPDLEVGDRTWPEIGADLTDREFEELHRDVDASEIARRIQILSKLAVERLSES